MPVPNLPANMSENDYEAIESAVMETVRGRWFLMEFARRNRSRELEQIRETLARLERAMSANMRIVDRAHDRNWEDDGAVAQSEAAETEAVAEWSQHPDVAAPALAMAPMAPVAQTYSLAALDALPIRDKIALFA